MDISNLGLPELFGALGVVATALAGYLTAKIKSKGQVKIKEVDSRTSLTLREQEALTKRQNQLAAQQKDFMNQMRDEVKLLREELNEERKRNNNLDSEVRDWRDKYLMILDKYQELVAENRILRDKLETYEERVSELEHELKIRIERVNTLEAKTDDIVDELDIDSNRDIMKSTIQIEKERKSNTRD